MLIMEFNFCFIAMVAMQHTKLDLHDLIVIAKVPLFYINLSYLYNKTN